MKKIFKKFTSVLVFILTLIVAFSFAGCAADGIKGESWAGSTAPGGSSGGSGWGDMPDGAPDMSDGSGDSSDPSAPGDESDPSEPDADPSEPDGEGSGNQQKPIAKQLTAAEWNDAKNYDFWLSLFESDVPFKGQDGVETTKDGIFSGYEKATRGLDSFDMHEVYVTSGENPAVGAKVTLFDESTVIYSAVTDSTGTAYVFGNGTHIEAVSGEFKAVSQISEDVTQISLDGSASFEDEIDIMFVVDTTGSMGDELSFLCKELSGIITRVTSSLTCKINLALLFYRDKGDQYVTKKYGFTDVTSQNGLSTVLKNIQAQRAAGGGDYPEAVDTALKEAVDADWNMNSKTRLIFHVLDAPYHDNQSNQSVFADAVLSASEKGIRIIPVAASGLDTLGQYIMRSAALLTGGTYTFLTDDSGIGNSHELPEVGLFTVEYLSDLMVRLIKGYYYGEFEEPVHWTQSESII